MPGRKSISLEIGWVEFEPTSSQPVLDRLPGILHPHSSPLTPPRIAGQTQREPDPHPESGTWRQFRELVVGQATW